QISACLAGFQSASAPQAGHENFLRATASGMAIIRYQPTSGGSICRLRRGKEKTRQRRAATVALGHPTQPTVPPQCVRHPPSPPISTAMADTLNDLKA